MGVDKPEALCMDLVAFAPYRFDQLALKASIDLCAQATHMSLDDIGFGIEVKLPDSFEKHGSRDHSVSVFHQEFEKPKLRGLQVDGFSSARDGTAQLIDLEVAHF